MTAWAGVTAPSSVAMVAAAAASVDAMGMKH